MNINREEDPALDFEYLWTAMAKALARIFHWNSLSKNNEFGDLCDFGLQPFLGRKALLCFYEKLDWWFSAQFAH